MIRKKIRLGDLLVDEGLITHSDLMSSLSKQRAHEERGKFRKIGEVLIEEGLITEKQMSIVLAKQMNIDFVDLYGEKIDYDLMSSFPLSLIKTTKILPFKETENNIYIATADPLDYDSLEIIERVIVRKPIKIFMALSIDIKNILERLEVNVSTRTLVDKVKNELKGGLSVVEGEETAISRLAELIFHTAINTKASDIHIEPSNYDFSVRARVDGTLREIFSFEKEIYGALVSKVKLLSNLDISEKRKAQDGRFTMTFNKREVYDFRVSTTPTIIGESIVIRILDQQKILLKLEELGMNSDNLHKLQKLLTSPYGILFVTGPTGSGKTTTLYAALNDLKSLENKVITVEDPVEYQIPLVQQIQSNSRAGYEFADALRAILRQDPDIIMIGEVRDDATLNAAIQAALTGHLVLATLHTNDAVSAVTRMVQMGAKPYLVADALVGVVAQRLIRRICPHCKEEIKLTPDVAERVTKYFSDDDKFYVGQGCRKCGMTGYMGREMISEVFVLSEKVSHMISQSADKFEIAEAIKNEGHKTLLHDAVRKVKEGATTVHELLRGTKL